MFVVLKIISNNITFIILEKLLNPVSQLNPSLNQNSDSMFSNQIKYIKTEPSLNETGKH